LQSEADLQQNTGGKMIKKSISLTIAVLLATMFFVQPTFAYSAADLKDKKTLFAEKVRLGVLTLGVSKQSVVEVKLRDKTMVKGYVSEMKDDQFSVTNVISGASTNIAYANVAQIRGNNLSTGAKIAIGIAIGVGAALIVLAIYLNCCTG
jgi:hypothetical protein